MIPLVVLAMRPLLKSPPIGLLQQRMTVIVLQPFVEVRESRAVGRILEVVVDFMNVAVRIVGEPLPDVVAVDLLNVFIIGMVVAVVYQPDILLPRVLQAHLRIEPVRCALLERPAAAALSSVEIYLLDTAEVPVRIEVDPKGTPVARVPIGPAPDKGAPAIAQPGIVKDIGVVVHERAIQQLV